MSSLNWRKARRSDAEGACVEVAALAPRAVVVRDSKDPDGPQLRLSAEAWRTLLTTLRASTQDVTV